MQNHIDSDVAVITRFRMYADKNCKILKITTLKKVFLP